MNKKIIKNCVVCEVPFTVYKCMAHRYATCSDICRRKYKEGSRNGRWRGGISHYRAAEQKTGLYKIWKRAVWVNCNGKCSFCGTDKFLEYDHIKPWALFPDLRYIVSNGRLLCDSCHKTTYKDFWKIRKELISQGTYERTLVPRKVPDKNCEECGKLFTPINLNPAYRFCKERCQANNQMRRYNKMIKLKKYEKNSIS